VKTVKPGDEFDLEGIKVTVVPAYNVNKYRAPRRLFHPKEELKVGYIIRFEGVSLYHAGDTDHIPEMDDIEAEVAFLPVSDVYVMTVKEAALATQRLHVKVAIPMHYGSIVGDEADAEQFKEQAACTVEILKKEE
jgi:L-ascorbate metabolism protein UlaG (beta-lactamase superfamily)